MTGRSTLLKEIAEIQELQHLLSLCSKREERLSLLWNFPETLHFLHPQKGLKNLIAKASKEDQEILLSLLALGQGSSIFYGWDTLEDPLFTLKHLANSLKPMQATYRPIGGLVGYHLIVLKLIEKREHPAAVCQTYYHPSGPHLNDKKNKKVTDAYVQAGIEGLVRFAEVYPVGGAADRMGLLDEKNGEPLPQARLIFDGCTLLSGLIRDLEAREKLYEKLYGDKILTPIVMMTSPEKRNTSHILEILDKARWFNRPKELFFLFEQPLVPMVSIQGDFATQKPLELCMKPGGHGMLWLLMQMEGVFDALLSLKRDKLLIRQINNPVAACDKNLLALLGKGISENKAFGFLSCQRPVGAEEGMNVVISTQNEDGYLSQITNIEYTDFYDRGFKDEPERDGSSFSIFPANTNILFADIKEIKKALRRLPLPGMLLNMKGEVSCTQKNGERIHLPGGRLETTMQNIADAIRTASKAPFNPEDSSKLSTFILFNDRSKTLSVTKRQNREGQSLKDTPEGAWRDVQNNWRELFEKLHFAMPETFQIHLHPALGPLWSLIAQKIQNGRICEGGELHLEVSEVFIRNLQLSGSLFIEAPSLEGRVFLKNVTLENLGVDSQKSLFWKGEITRRESVKILLTGSGEFFAEDVHLKGDHTFEVPSGHRMRLLPSGKLLLEKLSEKLGTPSWKWDYSFDKDHSPLLTFNG